MAIEEYFNDNNLDCEIVNYDFGNDFYVEWDFKCEGEDFKYIDDDVLYNYIEDVKEFRNENFEVFSYRNNIQIRLTDEFEESKKSTRKSMKESIQANRSNTISLQMAIEEYFNDNNLVCEIVNYDFGNDFYVEWDFECKGEDFKYIDDYMLYDYIKDVKEFRNENFEVFSYGNNIQIRLTDEFEESKKSTRKSMSENINAFDKAIAKKYNGTESNGAGQYYLDWRFDLKDEMDNIEMLADKYGVTVEFQSDDGYFEVFEESKKSVRKSLKERSEENEIIVAELQDTVEYFCGIYESEGELGKVALKDLKNAIERLEVFNAIGSIYQWGVEVLNDCGVRYKGL